MAASGEVLTYAELNDRSNRLAQYLYAQGLRRGDHVAILMENNIRYMEVCWAALRSGLYFTAINRYLPADEAAYVVEDCGVPGAGHVPGHAGGGRAACRHDPRLPRGGSWSMG